MLDVGVEFGYLGIVAANASRVLLDEYSAVESERTVQMEKI